MSTANTSVNPDLKIMSSSPSASGIPLSGMDQQVTPTDSFFVRNHFDPPTLSPSCSKLEVFGKVNKKLSLNYKDLKASPLRK